MNSKHQMRLGRCWLPVLTTVVISLMLGCDSSPTATLGDLGGTPDSIGSGVASPPGIPPGSHLVLAGGVGPGSPRFAGQADRRHRVHIKGR